MFMFWGKRTVLTRRLLKAKIRREYETECEAQTTATTTTTTTSIDNKSSIIDNTSRCVNKDLTGCTCSNYSRTININTTCDCSNLKCVNSKTTATKKQINKNLIVSDNNESVKSSSSSGGGGGCLIGTASKLHQVCCGVGSSSNNENDDDYDDYDEFDGRLTRCKELLKTLKENQLEMLLTSVESFGADIGACVLVSKKLNTISNSRQDNDMQMDHYKRSSHRHSLRNARHHHPLRHRHTHTTHRQRSKCRHCELRHGSSSGGGGGGGGGDDDDNESTTSDEFSSLTVNKTTPINLLSCQIWRWPDLCNSMELKKLPQCESAKDSSYVCCNPYHWSRLCKPESPPPPYCLIPSDRVAAANQEGAIQSSQMESRGNTAEPSRLPDSLTTDGEERNDGKKKEWCTLAYWELAGRVGSLYPVEASTVSVFDSLHDGDGLCLASLAQNHGSSAVVRRTRSKIGLGLMLSQEADGVWAYNRSDSPIFVNSPTLDDPESRTLLVYRVPPGFCLNIFDRTKRQSSLRLKYSDPLNSTGPIDANSVRISFAKGWGPKYSRQEVTSCPCWLEVLLAPCR